MNSELVLDTFHRTNRWDRVHRHQDELEQPTRLAKVTRVLFSTDPDVLGLYDKPKARNCQLWDHEFTLLLDGPKASRTAIRHAESIVLKGGLFEYRFFYPPMRVGNHNIYWHRPLLGFLSAKGGEVVLRTESLLGYITAYHHDDDSYSRPVELWPRLRKRPPYLAALRDISTTHDSYTHATSLNIINLLDIWHMRGGKPLSRSFTRRMLDLPKHKTLEQWLEELSARCRTPEAGITTRRNLEEIIQESNDCAVQRSITYGKTANRHFEEAWWNDIRFLACGDYLNKDNADVAQDDVTRCLVRHPDRDLERLGKYLIDRHRKTIAGMGMAERAQVGEQRFTWKTDFDFPIFGGWKGNQEGRTFERNILVLIPGKNRRQSVVLADHYDTAYMEATACSASRTVMFFFMISNVCWEPDSIPNVNCTNPDRFIKVNVSSLSKESLK